MISKSGIGSYTYPSQGNAAIRPHAVQSTSSQGNFTYDDNGNLKTGAGRSITWTSYDMPVQIQRGTITDNFVHGPEHQRLRQDRNDGSSLIYAGAQEVDTKGGTTIKTYWPGGLGVEIDKPGASTSDLYWHHKDRLGSPIALSSSDGSLSEKLAYDAWGRRRMIDGSAPLDNSTSHLDNKGYTGHEMLDQVELVHMNGRIYDPITARFLSGDPLIQDPINGQNYNRYSYVLNNPTNLTDPTGFATESVTIVGQRPICGFTCIAASAALALERMKSSALQSVMNSRSLTNRVASTGVTRAGLTRVAGVLNPVVAVAGAGYLGWQIGSEINDRWGDKIQGWLPDPMPIQNSDAVSNDAAGEKKSEDKPNLLDPKGDKHVLDGDGPNAGGGHRAGTGKPGKSEFPSSWSDDKIRGEISDVATDPSSTRKPGQGGRTIVQGTRDGIDITVVVEGSGRIVTGFPTNVPRNPP